MAEHFDVTVGLGIGPLLLVFHLFAVLPEDPRGVVRFFGANWAEEWGAIARVRLQTKSEVSFLLYRVFFVFFSLLIIIFMLFANL